MSEPTASRGRPSVAHRLRILVGESHRHEHLPVHEWLVRRALERQLAGATVYRAELGYGAGSRARADAIGSLSGDDSMVVELIDSRERLLDFVREIESSRAVPRGMATLDQVEVLFYRSE